MESVWYFLSKTKEIKKEGESTNWRDFTILLVRVTIRIYSLYQCRTSTVPAGLNLPNGYG